MKLNQAILTALIIVFMMGAALVHAGPGPDTIDERSLEKAVPSNILGETVPVSIYLPAGYRQSGRRYPVFYILEGELYFRAMTGIMDTRTRLGSIPGMIVVGLGTPDRWRDFTPTRAGVPGQEAIPSSGGGGRHMKFISDELIPRIEGEFRTEPFRMIFGHSIAGLQAINIMFGEPGLFGACMAISPSLWWDGEIATSTAKKTLESDRDFAGSLFLAIGSEDETMQEPLRRFAGMLAGSNPKNLRWTLKRCPDSDHQEVPLAAFNAGLSFIFSGWALPDSVFQGGLEAVDDHYERLSGRLGYRVDAPEGVLNRFGYAAMNSGDIEKAVSIFRRNVKTYPGSANVYDSLGEALLGRGDRNEALAMYRKALELDPENPRIRSTVDRLEKEISP